MVGNKDLVLKDQKGKKRLSLKIGTMYQGMDGLIVFFNQAGRMSDDGESKYQSLTLLMALGHEHDEKDVSVTAAAIFFA